MKTRKITSVEYWMDGMTSAMMVTKEDYYNPYLSCYPRFRIFYFDDGSHISKWEKK